MATSFFNNNCEDEVEELESAKQYADLARDWAIKMDGLVDGIDFSSKYWAQQSAEGAGLSVTIKEDGTPIGQDFTVFNFGAGVSATQVTTNEVLIQSTGQVLVETFDDGVGFIAGTSDEITLATEVVSKNNIDIYFDGVYQNKETYDVSGVLVTFDSIIPGGVGEIEVVYPRLMDVGVAAAENVTFDGSNVDVELVSLRARVTTNESDISSLEGRVTTTESDITGLDSRLTTAEADITSLDGRITTAESDIVSLDGRLTIVERSTLVNRPFPNVAAVDTATFLQTGDFVEWLGYTTPGDGGGNKGEIGTGFGPADNGSVFDLSGSGLQARGLFPSGIHTDVQWGSSKSGVDSTINIQAAIDYLNSIGGGDLRILPGETVVSGLVLKDFVNLIGEGKRQSILKLADSSDEHVLRTLNFDSLTGTDPSAGDIGQRNFGIKYIGIDGNKANQTIAKNGVAIYGFDYQIEEIEVFNCTGIGYYSESSNAVNSNSTRNLQPSIRNLDIHDNDLGNVDFNGQSDCTIVDVMAYVTGTGAGQFNFRLGAKANNVRVVGLHTFGTSDYGIINNAIRPHFVACTSESSSVSKVWATQPILWVGGRIFEVGANNSAAGFKLDVGFNTIIGCFASEIDGGLIDLSAGGSAGTASYIRIDSFTGQSGSLTHVGTLPASADLDLNIAGSTVANIRQARASVRHTRDSKGADVTAASNLVLGLDGNYFAVTGNTTIDTIDVTGWRDGDEITLVLLGSPTLTHAAGGSGQMVLEGSANIVASGTTGDVIKFIRDPVVSGWRQSTPVLLR